MSDGSIRNGYTIRVMNKEHADKAYELGTTHGDARLAVAGARGCGRCRTLWRHRRTAWATYRVFVQLPRARRRRRASDARPSSSTRPRHRRRRRPSARSSGGPSDERGYDRSRCHARTLDPLAVRRRFLVVVAAVNGAHDLVRAELRWTGSPPTRPTTRASPTTSNLEAALAPGRAWLAADGSPLGSAREAARPSSMLTDAQGRPVTDAAVGVAVRAADLRRARISRSSCRPAAPGHYRGELRRCRCPASGTCMPTLRRGDDLFVHEQRIVAALIMATTATAPSVAPASAGRRAGRRSTSTSVRAPGAGRAGRTSCT